MHKSKIIWVILAGGRATRMGGQDKGLVIFKDKPLISHVYHKLNVQHAKIVINANRNQTAYQQYAEVVTDLNSTFQGPLAGMQAAMTHLQADWFGFVPCDTPNLPDDLLLRMQQCINANLEALVAHDGEHIQPTLCMLSSTVLPKLNAFLDQGERKLGYFLSTLACQAVDFSHCPAAFANLNTPEDLIHYRQEG